MEIPAKKAAIAPEGVYIIGTYDENGQANAMNAAWGSQSDYGEVTFFLGKHKTTKNLKKTGAFVHVHKSAHVNAPIIEEYPLTLECLVTSYDDETGILVGKIVSEQADEAILTDGKVDYDKLKPIIFDIASMSYRVIGPVVGKAFHDGLSLKKAD